MVVDKAFSSTVDVKISTEITAMDVGVELIKDVSAPCMEVERVVNSSLMFVVTYSEESDVLDLVRTFTAVVGTKVEYFAGLLCLVETNFDIAGKL